MKKIILSAFLLTALLGNISISAQDKIGLQKYDYVTNGDANVFQGIPNIGLPLMGLDVPTTGIGINLSVNYTTESLARFSLVSDVGQGWNLSSIGSIVRAKTRMAEDYYKASNGKVDSDVFSYNYPGGGGKFFITDNNATHELTAVHASPSNDKITITKDTKEGKIKSFTITDTKGNTYLFDKLNINKMNVEQMITPVTKLINSGFFLSKIFNIRNEEVATIEYETTTEQFSQAILLQQQKIKKITVPGEGTIEYLYRHTGPAPLLSAEKDRDWYIVDKLVLKDTRNAVVNQYAFERPGDQLMGLINLDKNGNQIQKFSFEYNSQGNAGGTDPFGYPSEYQACDFDSGILRSPDARNPDACSYGALKSITLPSGGRTEYEFESQALPYNNSSPSNYYDHYPFEKIKTITYRTEPGEYPAPFTLPADYRVAMVKIDALHYGPPVRPGTPEYSIYINGVEPQPYTYGNNNNLYCPNGMLTFEGEGTLNFTFQGKSEGTIELYAFKKIRIDENDYGHGLRIKSIKNFNSGASSPLSYTKYEYNLFDNPLRSSGTILDQSMELNFMEASRNEVKPIGYTNIKVTDMINGSYSKYYFKNPDDITPGITPSYLWQDEQMNTYLRDMGLLQKKETYSEGQLLQKTEMSYQFKEVPLANILENLSPPVPVKKIVISKQGSTTENYISGMAKKLVSSSESNFEDTYNNMTSSKEILSDGTVVEKTLLYPADKGVQKLLIANMIDIPLETSTKRNGKLVGKAETKFDDSSHLYPTSVIGYNMQTQSPFTASTLDLYDSKGNLVQITGKNGIPTTTIWGYYQTKPIAVISGAAYSQIASLATVTAAIAASNADRDNPATEPALLQALEALRKDPALKNYSVTATTYDPMIGVTHSISANGIRTINVYDNANRLVKVTDAEGKTLQESQYNYKH
ncbi:hypothetical protein EG346_23095 [Chryseobacterium carnipullorum]|uniref:YD repeat-containing protein n=1 Tax=Chryseobacterium carnipullorum TaxID=1124835 RepID=A0A3G6NCY9_CHRCU|nr:hypothetical protein [Chryseobacterium carnipullorum]AZA50882.1 hypothetical protein EG346_23095 [Chryseobacterium carnipullorum]AZA65744.1 hypothetical protein EG345_14195 [Chryseobacterium carnipullorum]